MSRIGRDEKLFCEHHNIPVERLVDAAGQASTALRELMKVEEKWAAYGGRPCGPGGHRLRNRHGTCLMCDPSRVAFLLRSKLPGFIYIASGGGRRLMKIGFSTQPVERIKIANYEGWGGHYDWRLLACAWSAHAGRLESDFHRHFHEARIKLHWSRNGLSLVTREAYLADFDEALVQLVNLCDGLPQLIPPGAEAGWMPHR